MSIQERRANAVEKCLGRSKNPKLLASWKVGEAQYASDGMVAYKFVGKAVIDGLPQLADDSEKINLEELFKQRISKPTIDMYFDTAKNIKNLAIKPCYKDKEGNKIVAIGFINSWNEKKTLCFDAKLFEEAVTAMSLSDEDTITFAIFGEKRPVLVENEAMPDSMALICPFSVNDEKEYPPYVFSTFAKKDYSEETLKELSEKHIQALEKQKTDELKKEMKAVLRGKTRGAFQFHLKRAKALAIGIKADDELKELQEDINTALEGLKLEKINFFDNQEAKEETEEVEKEEIKQETKEEVKEEIKEEPQHEEPKVEEVEEKTMFVFEDMDLLDRAI